MDGSASSDLDTGSLPNISDYWPDAPHRMSPEADWYPDDSEPTADFPPYTPEPPADHLIGPPPRSRGRGLRLFLAALAAVVFVGGSGLVLARMVLNRDNPVAQPAPEQPDVAVTDPDNPPVSVQPSPAASATPSPSVSAAATALPFTSGTFELSGNVVELNVTVADLGFEPVKFSTPDGSGLAPRLNLDGGTVKLDPRPDGSKGNGRVDVQLNSKVTWSIRMAGGVTRGNFTLGDAKLRRIDLDGGATRITMVLPTPDETMPLRMTGGVNTWQITTLKKVPLSALLRQGAGEVSLNGKKVRSLKKGASVRADGGAGVESGGFGIDAVAGIGTLTVGPAA
ncbi:hypothetical protein BJ973_001723 [Actinoplanes tereljensis]|uniref:Uncharacterized protein n=1 Tax=Paractinoplanes tereljensis TaxID=571912 RepID=A0A919NM59_9ACTN|nr:hypothetical protein [Actinoplanes tereljensis]GIF20372.1 hypothetical protein Ate02nite_31020 [Actinoplanes tereljensis]